MIYSRSHKTNAMKWFIKMATANFICWYNKSNKVSFFLNLHTQKSNSFLATRTNNTNFHFEFDLRRYTNVFIFVTTYFIGSCESSNQSAILLQKGGKINFKRLAFVRLLYFYSILCFAYRFINETNRCMVSWKNIKIFDVQCTFIYALNRTNFFEPKRIVTFVRISVSDRSSRCLFTKLRLSVNIIVLFCMDIIVVSMSIVHIFT